MTPTLTALIGLIGLNIVAQPLAALSGGALISQTLISPLTVFIALFVTDMSIDSLWYALGYYNTERVIRTFERFFRITPSQIERARMLFHTRPAFILITAKLLGGLGVMPIILFGAGTARMKYWRYIGLNAIGDSIWNTVLVAIGYASAASIMHVEGIVQKTFLGLALIIISAVSIYLLHHFVRRYFDI